MNRRSFLKMFAATVALASLEQVTRRYDKEQMRLAKSRLPQLAYVVDTNSGIIKHAYGSDKTFIMLEKMGWLPCDGRPLCRTTYANLFQAIGVNYGASSQTEFRIPDLRSQYLVTK